MINICFALHDEKGTYAKYTAVAMLSAFLCTEEKVRVFLLHDETLSNESKHRFDSMISKYGHSIEYFSIDVVDEWKKLKNINTFTVGTMFRLLIPKVLSSDIDKVLYLDSDIVVDMDISELWNMNFGNKLILGRKELHYDNPIFEQGVDEDTYINAGVLLFNLEGIRRKYDFFNETTAYLKAHPDCMWNDEDAINYVLDGQQGVIENRFNSYTSKLREKNEKEFGSCIYHFAGDFPHLINMEYYDILYFDILKETPFGKGIKIKELADGAREKERKKRQLVDDILEKVKSVSNIVFWGAKITSGYKEVKNIVDFSDKEVCFVDSNEELTGTRIDGYCVCDLNYKMLCKDAYVVVLAYNHYEEISKVLKHNGFVEYKDYACVTEMIYSDNWMKDYLDKVI